MKNNTLNIIENLLDINEYSRSGIKLNSQKGLVIHYTDSATTTFSRNFEWLYTFLNKTRPAQARYASYHYAIDQDGTIYHLIPDNECAWHAGPSSKTYPAIEGKLGGKPNWNTISISFLHPEPSGKPTKETYDSLVALSAYLVSKYGISTDNIFRHYDCVGKVCPKYYVNNATEWNTLKQAIEQEVHDQKVEKATGLGGFTQ